jgi:hypothetical protein
MENVFETRFGMFVPCDRETYRKLKRIRHLAGFAEVMARRWTRAQRRLPNNRVFRRGRERRVVTERMLFGPFWVAGSRAVATPLLVRLMQAYGRARHPVAVREEVEALGLDAGEIGALLERIEEWHRDVFVIW